MPRTPTEVRPAKTRTSLDREADRFAVAGGEQHVVRVGAGRDGDQPVVGILALEFHRDLAVGPDVAEIAQRVAPDIAVRGREHDGQIGPAFLVLGQRHDRRDRLARRQIGQQIDHRPAARLRRAERQAIDLELVDPPRRGEEQHRREGRGDKNLAEEILLADRHAGAAAAAAPLRAIGRQRHPLDVAGMADRHDHVLALDQRLDVGLELDVLDRRSGAGSRTAP